MDSSAVSIWYRKLEDSWATAGLQSILKDQRIWVLIVRKDGSSSSCCCYCWRLDAHTKKEEVKHRKQDFVARVPIEVCSLWGMLSSLVNDPVDTLLTH